MIIPHIVVRAIKAPTLTYLEEYDAQHGIPLRLPNRVSQNSE